MGCCDSKKKCKADPSEGNTSTADIQEEKEQRDTQGKSYAEQNTEKNKENKNINVKQLSTNGHNSDRKSVDQTTKEKQKNENKTTEQPVTSEDQLKQKSIDPSAKKKQGEETIDTNEVQLQEIDSTRNWAKAQQDDKTAEIHTGKSGGTNLKQDKTMDKIDKASVDQNTDRSKEKQQIKTGKACSKENQIESAGTEAQVTNESLKKSPTRPDRTVTKQKFEEMKERFERAKRDVEEKQKGMQNMVHNIKQNEKMIEDLQKEIKDSNKKLEAKVKESNVEKDKMQKEQKKKEKEANEEYQDILNQMEDLRNQKDAALARNRDEIELLKAEKEKLLLRISEMAGRRLTDNNPNIADLSDLNRPTKLAERYSELYDNEWTDAISYLETTDAYKNSETERIKALLFILTIAYRVSIKTAAKQLNDLQTLLNAVHWNLTKEDSLVKDTLKQFKDQRKRSTMPSADLLKEYRTEIINTLPNIKPSSVDSNDLDGYLQKCLQLCWLMVIQDPPVYLECDVCKKGETFNKNLFKEYTQSGQFVMYTVWPAVFLEKGGALLCKGVVQCEKEITREERSKVLKEDKRRSLSEKQNRSSASTHSGDSSNISKIDEHKATESTVHPENENTNKTDETYL